MPAHAALLSILGALLIGAISPGPSFVMVARMSVALSRLDGLAAALGMGTGGVVYGALALLGLQALLAQVEWLYLGMKVAGGLYLIHLAIKLWRGAARPIDMTGAGRQDGAGAAKSFWLALCTQLSNPKTAIAYASIFAALLPPQPPLWMIVVLPPLIFLVETSWYAVVALAFSSDRPRGAYLRAKRWIDRLAGSVMALLGVRLILDAGSKAMP
jgi:threonine/homoserine/homoserine lactone efflux protein